MKPLKKINLIFFGLTLVLSLVSFSGDSNQSYKQAIKTALVVTDVKPDLRYSIQFQKVNKTLFVSLQKYFKTSFYLFKKTQDLKESTSFKAYSNTTFYVSFLKLHKESFALKSNKILYNNFIV